MKILIVFFFFFFSFEQESIELERDKIKNIEIKENESYYFKYKVQKNEIFIPINIFSTSKFYFKYYVKCNKVDLIPNNIEENEHFLKHEFLSNNKILYEDFFQNKKQFNQNKCEYLFIKITILSSYSSTKNIQIKIPIKNLIIEYKENYPNFKYEEIENENELYYFLFNQNITNIFFFSKNNVIKVFYGISNLIFSRKFNQYSYISNKECIIYNSTIIIRLLSNDKKITFSYLLSNKNFGFSEYDFSSLNNLIIPINISNCVDNEIYLFGGFNSFKNVYLITDYFYGDYKIYYSNKFGDNYAFNYIDFSNINSNYTEFNNEFMVFKIECNIPSLFNFRLIESMNITFLKIKGDEYFYNLFDFSKQNQLELQVHSSNILSTKIIFYPKSENDSNYVNLIVSDNNYTLSKDNQVLILDLQPKNFFYIYGSQKTLISFHTNNFLNYMDLNLYYQKTLFPNDMKNFFINISNIPKSINNLELNISTQYNSILKVNYEYYKSNIFFFPMLPKEKRTELIFKDYNFTINITNPYYYSQENCPIYLLIRITSYFNVPFYFSNKNYSSVVDNNNYTILPVQKINYIENSTQKLIYTFPRIKNLNKPYIYFQIFPCNKNLTDNNYTFYNNEGKLLSSLFTSNPFIKFYINSYQDIILEIENKKQIENFLIWYYYKKEIEYINEPKNLISILKRTKNEIKIEFHSVSEYINYTYNIYIMENEINKCSLILRPINPISSFNISGIKWINYTISGIDINSGFLIIKAVSIDKSYIFFYETKNISEVGSVYSKNEKNDFYDNYYLGSYSYFIATIIIIIILFIFFLAICTYLIYSKCIKIIRKGYIKQNDPVELSELKSNSNE